MDTNNTPRFCPLDLEIRVALTTKEAAFHLNRAEQTLRLWTSKQSGPLQPVKVNGRLAWLVADIRRVLAGGA